jgi:hypothetical protein
MADEPWPVPDHVMYAFAATAEIGLSARARWAACASEDDIFAWVQTLRPMLVRITELCVADALEAEARRPRRRRPAGSP